MTNNDIKDIIFGGSTFIKKAILNNKIVWKKEEDKFLELSSDRIWVDSLPVGVDVYSNTDWIVS